MHYLVLCKIKIHCTNTYHLTYSTLSWPDKVGTRSMVVDGKNDGHRRGKREEGDEPMSTCQIQHGRGE